MEGKVDVDRQRRKSLTRQGVSTEAQFLRTIGGTPKTLSLIENVKTLLTLMPVKTSGI